MKIEETPTKLDGEHVTKGLIHLGSSIPNKYHVTQLTKFTDN